MKKRYLIPVIFAGLVAVPAIAQDHSCSCDGPGHDVVIEKVIHKTIVIDDCAPGTACGTHGRGGHYWHPHAWHPHVPGKSDSSATGRQTDTQTGRQTATAGGATVNIYNTPAGSTVTQGGQNQGATTTGSSTSGGASGSSGASTTGSTSSSSNGTASSTGSSTSAGSSASGSTSSTSSGGNDVAILNDRIGAISGWMGALGWLTVLAVLLIVLLIVWFILWTLRGTRHESETSYAEARHTAERVEELQDRLREKDSEIERITAEATIARRDAEREAAIHTHVERVEPRVDTVAVVEDAGLVATGATIAKSRSEAEAARLAAETAAQLDARLRQRDLELDRIRDELARLRHDLEHQRDSAVHSHTIHTHSHAEPAAAQNAAVEVEKVVVVTTDTVAEPVVAEPAPVVHHHAAPKPPVHSVIDEADWSITHYRVVIGEARAQKHDRPHARAEVIRLSELMLAHYPDHPEAVSFARVSKAEALAEGGNHAAALMECETVIAHYGADTSKAVRTQLAHAHFVKAAIHAQHRDVAQCTAELDQWAKVYGIFDQRMVTEDVRFQEITKVTEFQVYIAHKTH